LTTRCDNVFFGSVARLIIKRRTVYDLVADDGGRTHVVVAGQTYREARYRRDVIEMGGCASNKLVIWAKRVQLRRSEDKGLED
jgi:hypothetical protein